MKKSTETIFENRDGTHFVLLHTWSFYKKFDVAWCDKYDLSVLCLLQLYIINSIILKKHLQHLLL